MQNLAILSSGKSLPRHVLHNQDLEGFLDTSHSWIKSRTGIEERRVAGFEEDNLSMSIGACRQALSRGGFQGDDIDLIIVATTTPDRMCPALACTLQKELGASGPAMDINAGCSGFVYALVIAYHLIRGGMANRALVVGTETLTRIVDWSDRSTCVIFGDGAGAVVLGPCAPAEGILAMRLGASGEGDDFIQAGGGGARMMASLSGGLEWEDTYLPSLLPFLGHGWSDYDPFLRMDGREVFRFAVAKLRDMVGELSEAAGVKPGDVDLIIPHQANQRIIAAVAEKLRLPPERFFVNIARYGNTSAASVPIALDEALGARLISEGDLVILAGFGAGLTWGGAILRWPANARDQAMGGKG